MGKDNPSRNKKQASSGRSLTGMTCQSMNTCVANIEGVVQFGANAALVATAPGVSTKTAVADAAGAYTFRYLPPGTWTLRPSAEEAAAYEYTPASVSVPLSGNGNTAFAPTMTREPLLSTTPWLPQCKSVNAGAAYTLLAQPASAPASSASVVNTGMTGDEYLANTGFDASKLVPMPLPIADGNVTSAAVCAADAAYSVGPTSSRTTCWLVSCFSGQCPTKWGICSGTFVADPSGQGRLLFLTATHCVARSSIATDIMLLTSSFVTCNRDAGVPSPSSKQGDGIFQPTALTMSRIDFTLGYGIKDGALIQLLALSNTNLAYAKPVAVGAVTNAGLAANVPNFSAGFPQVDDGPGRIPTCTAANLGNTNAIHYSRKNAVRTLVNIGIQVPGFSGCGGNSGGTVMDEAACVQWGVLSATSTLCNNGASTNTYSRIVATLNEVGVPFLSLASGLVAGQTLFVN